MQPAFNPLLLSSVKAFWYTCYIYILYSRRMTKVATKARRVLGSQKYSYFSFNFLYFVCFLCILQNVVSCIYKEYLKMLQARKFKWAAINFRSEICCSTGCRSLYKVCLDFQSLNSI